MATLLAQPIHSIISHSRCCSAGDKLARGRARCYPLTLDMPRVFFSLLSLVNITSLWNESCLHTVDGLISMQDEFTMKRNKLWRAICGTWHCGLWAVILTVSAAFGESSKISPDLANLPSGMAI